MPLVARVQSPLFSPIFRLRYEATVPKATQALGHVDDAYWCPAFSVASLPDPEALRLSRKAAIAGGCLVSAIDTFCLISVTDAFHCHSCRLSWHCDYRWPSLYS